MFRILTALVLPACLPGITFAQVVTTTSSSSSSTVQQQVLTPPPVVVSDFSAAAPAPCSSASLRFFSSSYGLTGYGGVNNFGASRLNFGFSRFGGVGRRVNFSQITGPRGRSITSFRSR